MRVTIENEFNIATVESKPNYPTLNDTECEELADLIKSCCLAVGYQPGTVAEIFNESGK